MPALNEPKREAQVKQSMNSLAEEIEFLDKSTGELIARLQPVVEPSTATAGEPTKEGVKEQSCEIATFLEMKIAVIHRIRCAIQETTAQLQI